MKTGMEKFSLPHNEDFFNCIVGSGVQLGPLGTAATNRPTVPAPYDYDDDGKNWWNNWQGKQNYSEKTCPSAALSTINPTFCPEANPDRRGGKPATNRLSYGTAMKKIKRIKKALRSVFFAQETL
jgi:hypothetical protein